MKFYIAEQNIGSDATKEQAEKLIELLKAKGWDVEYGIGRNVATEISEFGQEESIQDTFADDFMLCLSLMEEWHPLLLNKAKPPCYIPSAIKD